MKVFGGLIAVMAVLIGAIPHFNNCLYEGKLLTLANGRQVPMKCYWTAQAELAIAVPLLAIGIMLVFSRRRETVRALGATAIILGAFAILLPATLIGVCTTMTASCNQIMRPAIEFLGALVIGTSIGAIVVSERWREPKV